MPTNSTPKDRLEARMEKVVGGVFRNDDGLLHWHDLESNTIHLVEIRTFDVTGIPDEQRKKLISE